MNQILTTGIFPDMMETAKVFFFNMMKHLFVIISDISANSNLKGHSKSYIHV